MKIENFEKIINFIKEIFTKDFIPLHEPKFIGKEKKYVLETIESTFVSSVGEFVDKIEEEISKFTGAKFAIATVNGTSALHIALMIAGVKHNDEVITQPVTFVATCNAISYCGATPVFVDIDLKTLGMSPESLKSFLERNCKIVNEKCINTITGKIIKACVPMHTFGHPCEIDAIKEICENWNITLIEDAAESLGSFYKNKHTGTFGDIGIFSFNGNKIITSGGGGIIITDNETLAGKAKRLTTTAKLPHKWEYIHDEIGYNYRMPNINAALLFGQFENLEYFIKKKRELAENYKNFFETNKLVKFFTEPKYSKSNYWLNSIIFNNKKERNDFLEYSNENGIMTRPVWKLMNRLPMYNNCYCESIENAICLEERLVNIPSSVRI